MDRHHRTKEERNVTDKLSDCETWLKAIIRESPIPQFVIDINHRIIHWNKALEQYSGIKLEDVIGTNQQWRAFYTSERPCMADLLVDNAIDRIPELYSGKYEKSKLVEGSYEATYFYPHMGQSGVWLYLTATAIRDAEGSIIGALETLEDITERKTATDALKDSEKRYRTLFNSMLEGYAYCRMIYDDEGHPADWIYLSVNPAFEEITGLKKITGKKVTEAIPDIADAYPKLFESYGRVARTGTSEKFDIYFSPIQKWLHIFVHSPEKDFFVVVFEDITERKQAEEALLNVNKKLNMLSSITRHDILNQIMVVRGYLDLSEGLLDSTQLQDFVKKEHDAIDRIQKQIEFTRYYQNIGVEEPKWQDAGEIIDAVGESLDLPGVTLENNLTGIEVFADPLIEKVFYNLIENSLRHGEHVTVISYSCRETESGLLINYLDNGIGISKEDKKKLFQKGFGKNTGLGLFLSREILSISGITIRECGEPGNGVNFEMLVPKGGYRFNA